MTRFAGAEVAACAVCGLPPLTVSRAGVPLCESHGEEALLDAWRAAGSPLVRLPPPRSIPDLEYRLKGAPVPPDGEGIRQIIAALEAQTERQP